MEMSKYYRAKEAPAYLTLTTHPGKLTYQDLVQNIMRMILMNEENLERLSAEEALQKIDQMPPKEYKSLQEQAEDNLDWREDLKDFLSRNNIQAGMELTPYQETLDELEQLSMQEFLEMVVPQTEWDHGDNYSVYQKSEP